MESAQYKYIVTTKMTIQATTQPGLPAALVPASSVSMGVEVAGSAPGVLEAMEKRVAKKSID